MRQNACWIQLSSAHNLKKSVIYRPLIKTIHFESLFTHEAVLEILLNYLITSVRCLSIIAAPENISFIRYTASASLMSNNHSANHNNNNEWSTPF